ncbi:hypothetical protein [Planctomicrobium sp. SH527]|uniref:hypothetical protein n=1 Tax=Planctomicrobium sp. SH527 TaxID=3448123 RepID=UPI003F5B37C5
MAQRLPVGLIPEQLMISLMRDNVIHTIRWSAVVLLQAMAAQCILGTQQEGFRSRSPPGIVTTLAGGGSIAFADGWTP